MKMLTTKEAHTQLECSRTWFEKTCAAHSIRADHQLPGPTGAKLWHPDTIQHIAALMGRTKGTP